MIRHTKAEVALWPPSFRPCVKCKVMLNFDEFHEHSGCLFGINTVCKACRLPLSKTHYHSLDDAKRLWHTAKTRSAARQLEFSINIEDIVVPNECPVLGVPLKRRTIYAPSLDRKDSSKGYIKGNIQVISLRANVLKSNGSSSEMEKVLAYIKVCELI